MPPRRKSVSADDDLAFRVGSSAAGLLGGGALGFIAASILAAFASDQFFPLFVFGGSILGGVAGYVSSAAGFGIGEAAVHLGIGIVSGLAERFHGASENSPMWLKVLFWFGLGLGALLLVFRRL
jgi:hypothetical protein